MVALRHGTDLPLTSYDLYDDAPSCTKEEPHGTDCLAALSEGDDLWPYENFDIEYKA